MRLQSLGMMGGDLAFSDMWYVEESYVSYLMKKVEHFQKIIDEEIKCKFDSLMEKVTFKKSDEKDHERDTECAICLKEFEEKEELIFTTCKHLYHEDCLRKWLIERQVCPLCKYSLLADSVDD